MDFLLQNLAESLMVLGILALIIEVAVLGFSTFVLFFFGLSLLITGGLMTLDVLSANASTAFWSNAILTALLSLSLWQPLKKMQSQTDDKQVKHDFADHSFVLESDVDSKGESLYQYSGINWKLKSEQPIEKGTLVRITHMEVGVLWVEAAAE